MPSEYSVFIAAFSMSAFAGLAALLRSDKEITWTRVASATLNSGMLGLGMSLIWYTKYIDNLYTLIGLCVLFGLGGPITVDAATAVVRRVFGDKS